MSSSSKLSLLLDLAKETSSEKRRDLLREISQAFVADPSKQSRENIAALDDIALSVVSDVTSEVRAELATMLTDNGLPLSRTSRHLALDGIEIARPVIERWRAVTQNDLLEIVTTKSQEHLMAVTKRSDIEEPISEVLVSRGEDRVVASLLSNESAKIGRGTYEKISERAQKSTLLQEPFARRRDVPMDLMAKLYNSVSTDLRKELSSRYENVPTDVFDAALEKSWIKVEKMYSALPEDFEAAQVRLKRIENVGDMKPPLLVRLIKEGKKSKTLTILAFAKLVDEDFHLINRLIEARDVDAIGLICRAAGFDKLLFETIISFFWPGSINVADVAGVGMMYEKVPIATALRAQRFWKVRALI